MIITMGNEVDKDLADRSLSVLDSENSEQSPGDRSPSLSPLAILKESPFNKLPFFNKKPQASPVSEHTISPSGSYENVHVDNLDDICAGIVDEHDQDQSEYGINMETVGNIRFGERQNTGIVATEPSTSHMKCSISTEDCVSDGFDMECSVGGCSELAVDVTGEVVFPSNSTMETMTTNDQSEETNSDLCQGVNNNTTHIELYIEENYETTDDEIVTGEASNMVGSYTEPVNPQITGEELLLTEPVQLQAQVDSDSMIYTDSMNESRGSETVRDSSVSGEAALGVSTADFVDSGEEFPVQTCQEVDTDIAKLSESCEVCAVGDHVTAEANQLISTCSHPSCEPTRDMSYEDLYDLDTRKTANHEPVLSVAELCEDSCDLDTRKTANQEPVLCVAEMCEDSCDLDTRKAANQQPVLSVAELCEDSCDLDTRKTANQEPVLSVAEMCEDSCDLDTRKAANQQPVLSVAEMCENSCDLFTRKTANQEPVPSVTEIHSTNENFGSSELFPDVNACSKLASLDTTKELSTSETNPSSDEELVLDMSQHCEDCTFSLSDIEDVFEMSNQSENATDVTHSPIINVSDLNESQDMAEPEPTRIKSISLTELDQSQTVSELMSSQSQTISDYIPDQSQAMSEYDLEVDQSQAISELNPSEVLSGSVLELNQSGLVSESVLEFDQSDAVSESGHSQSQTIYQVKISASQSELGINEQSSELEIHTISQSVSSPDLNQAQVECDVNKPDTTPVLHSQQQGTGGSEDRIDRIYALLHKYKAYKAKLQASEASESVSPEPCSVIPVSNTGHDGVYTESIDTTEDRIVHDKLERSWEDNKEDSFPQDCFEQLQDEAEHRIAARRAARQEAREIRMREIERQQREAEEREKDGKPLNKSITSRALSNSRHVSSRQDSGDDSTTTEDMRALKKDLCEMDDKYTKAMMDNAQLDNEKQMLRYEVDLLKDRLEDLSEEHIELQREHKDKCRDYDQKKRENTDLTDEVAYLKQQLQQRDQLIEEYGLVFVSNETLADDIDKDRRREATTEPGTTALVTRQAADVLRKQGEGSLDHRLTQFDEIKKEYEDEIKKLKQQLDTEKERSALAEKYSTPPRMSHISNGPDVSEMQMDSQRLLNECKFKLKKAQQDITTLEGNVIRLESQSKRYKQSSENSEKNEEELKTEKRKLQRELREAQSTVEELQTSNQHLQKRMEKMKSARNAILKS